jgi:hypothetical protein
MIPEGRVASLFQVTYSVLVADLTTVVLLKTRQPTEVAGRKQTSDADVNFEPDERSAYCFGLRS